MTQFQQAVAQAKMGELKTPSVSFENKDVDYFWYQLVNHQYCLRVMAAGLKFRGIKLSEIKSYYGLKGRTAKDCLPQFNAIMENYRQNK